jgi:cytoplasmic iron level regulating protein YaaA (DUF328/UPF0246 family)
MPDIQPTSLTTEELYRYAMLKRYKNESLDPYWQDAILEALRKALVELDSSSLFSSYK